MPESRGSDNLAPPAEATAIAGDVTDIHHPAGTRPWPGSGPSARNHIRDRRIALIALVSAAALWIGVIVGLYELAGLFQR